MAQALTIDRLLNQVPDSPSVVLSHLQAHPELASKQDSHGYSLLHAAVSYGHVDLMKALVQIYHVDVDIKDEDRETALFNAESVEVAQEFIQLGVDIDVRNADGQTAAEKLDDEDEQPLVAAYLRNARSPEMSPQSGSANGTIPTTSRTGTSGQANGVHAPPPMPNGVQVEVGTMEQGEEGEAPDPEFRRRIEELAAREDFEGEAGQRELRELITDAVSGLGGDSQAPAASRRRLG